ncbi:MAG TPA: cytochrome P450 [Mycobacteriales bacterium]|nr:cytochrome P450 [Mycobacteriales bacterium]
MSVSTPSKIAISYDHHSPEYAGRWRELHDQMRTRCPVARSDSYDGFYVLTRYEDVAAAIKDDATFASLHQPGTAYQGIIIPESPTVSTPIELDPPEFTAYRKLLNPWFSPGAAAAWSPWLKDVTTALIDAFIERGSCELIDEFASPLPAMLTAKLLGLPMQDWRLYSTSAHDIVRFPPDSPEFEQAVVDLLAVLAKYMETVARCRETPGDDLISSWVQATVNGEPIPDQTLMEMGTLVIAGGNDTTTALFGNAFVWLSQHPDQRAWLGEDFARIPAACEEFLRYFTPTQALARTVTRDVEFAGHSFRAGDRVLLSFAAANFDPTAFDDPHTVKLDRFPNKHTAFGLGLHRCIGSNFTRNEFRIGLEQILRRLPDFHVDDAASSAYGRIGTVNGWNHVPATFTPGPVEGSDFTL